MKQHKNKPSARGAVRKVDCNSRPFAWKRCLSTLFALVLISTLFWAGPYLLNTLDRPLQTVRISGQLRHLDVAVIEKMVQQRVDAGLLAADLLEIKEMLLAQPWIAQVAVRRKWPNLLQIDLVEQTPVARWNKDQLLTADAVVFRPSEGVERFKLPHLLGTKESRNELLFQYAWLKQQLGSEGLTVAELRKEQRGAWYLLLAEGPRIYLGRDALTEKVKRFRRLYQQVLKEHVGDIERIDLRYTHGISVRWKADQNGAATGLQSRASNV